MSLSADLLRHAVDLLGDPSDPPKGTMDTVVLRRAVSAAYYALFHRLCEAGAERLGKGVGENVANRIYRSLNHNDAKYVCVELGPLRSESALQVLIQGQVPPDLQKVAKSFVSLQQTRHSADYDPQFQLRSEEAKWFIDLASAAIAAWERIHQTPEAHVFILALFLRKNWERDR